MRLPLAWLAEFVPLPPAAELARRLELAGFEDVTVQDEGPDLSEIRIGRVERCERHPDADKLSVCQVDVADGTARTIVCGAPNVAAGQKVAVALPGARLPDGTKIKKAKLRGVVSEGMICSRRELGLGGEHQGILVLDANAPIGRPLSELLGGEGAVIEIGLTPNRGDAASLLGIAREVRALFGATLRIPDATPLESGAPGAQAARVRIDAPDLCWRYSARIVRGVRISPTPDCLRRRLEASGFRSINNVVDATNQVLLELGQPIHAFDLAKLRGAEVRVRRAYPGERLVTLDGVDRALDPSDLVIADAERAVALAGVMGGAESEVTETTTDILIESAQFLPASVRRSARRHGLHSEASYRFERGVDREGIVRGADRAARLVAELAGGAVAPGRIDVRGAPPPVQSEVLLDVARMNRLLGTSISREEAASLLARLGIESAAQGEDALRCAIPSHRNDLALPQDLAEEVARLYGYDRIPTSLPVAEVVPAKLPAGYRIADRARTVLAGLGLTEMMTMPFVAADELERLRLDERDPRRVGLHILNPVQEQDSRLRTTLLPSLLRVARQNRSRQVDRVAVFEICRVFVPRPGEAMPDEPLQLAALVTRGRDRRLWDPPEPPPLFFEARGIAERLFTGLGYEACLRRGGNVAYLHPGAQSEIAVSGRPIPIGSVGELHPELLRDFELDAPAALVEIDLGALASVAVSRPLFREPSREPAIRRDLAVLIDRHQAAGDLQEEIRKQAGSDLVSVELFDRYEGAGLPPGRVSIAFRLVFQRSDRTLVDTEVNRAMDQVVRALSSRFGAELR
ncbi:MAG TPA: phenylalanine--tRNA ligase subunit beta [Myxococcota bacterium]|nr:phenylalanine--tRNA ligase subunit beta [Myxococcota bacterium]